MGLKSAHVYSVQARVGTPHPPPPASSLATKTPNQMELAPSHTRGAWAGVLAGTRRLPAGAPFTEPQLTAGRAWTLLFSPHSLVPQQCAFTLICIRNGGITCAIWFYQEYKTHAFSVVAAAVGKTSGFQGGCTNLLVLLAACPVLLTWWRAHHTVVLEYNAQQSLVMRKPLFAATYCHAPCSFLLCMGVRPQCCVGP